jgi:hypothetical protein
LAERIANKIVLAEDTVQQNLVRRYLERCGHETRECRFVPLPARGRGGSGERYVRDQYAPQVQACRSSLGRRAAALLIVVIDADMETTEHRRSQLSDALRSTDMNERRDDEPIVLLIPKRHIETWIRALLGEHADEVTDYTKAPYLPPTSNDIRTAAAELYVWTRPGAASVPSYPASLTASLPEWQKIPS